MAADCLPQVSACMLRVCKLDSSGLPKPGAASLYVSDALVSVQFGWEVEAGDEIKEKNGCGDVLVNYKAPDTLRRGNITINLLTPDPQLSEMLSTGSQLVPSVGPSSGSRGYSAPPLGTVVEEQVSVEVWAKRIRDGVLDPTWPYAWWVYPWVDNLRPADHEQGNKNFPMSFVGQAHENVNWTDGPDNLWPVASNRVYQWIPWTTIPTAVCGYVTLNAS